MKIVFESAGDTNMMPLNIRSASFSFLKVFLLSILMLNFSATGPLWAEKTGKAPSLKISQVRLDGGLMEIICEIRNRTENPLWVYVGDNRTGTQSYVTKAGRKSNSLYIGFRSTGAIGNLPAEEAVLPRYKSIEPGSAIMFRLTLDEVVRDFQPFRGMGEGSIKSAEIRKLEMEMGYYSVMLDSEEGCCMPAERFGELYVIPAWGAAHPESTVSVKVSQKKRWK